MAELTTEEADYLIAKCEFDKTKWLRNVTYWETHDAIVKRDECAEKVARLDALIDKLRKVTV